MNTALAIMLIFSLIGNSSANPLSDLSSSSQAVRDNAAAKIRMTTFQPTPESKWTPIIAKIKKGQSKVEVLELLPPSTITLEDTLRIDPGSYFKTYRLDNEWTLVCRFTNKDNILIYYNLAQDMKRIRVEPPENYSGKWIMYFINGQICHEINYKDGKYFGEFRAYRSDGSVCYVQHYNENGGHGLHAGYYPSGEIKYHGKYKDGKEVGIWKWFDENGKVTSEKEYPE